MSKTQNLFGTLRSFDLGNGQQGALYALPQLEKAGLGPVSRLPVSIRLVLESVLRNCDGKRVLGAERARAGQLEADGAAHGGDPVRGGAHRVAGLHRACRCWWTWRRCARRWRGWAGTPS